MAQVIKIIKLKNLTIQELEMYFIFSDLSDMKDKEYTVIKETETEYKIRRFKYGLSSFIKEIFEIVGEKKSSSPLHHKPLKKKPVYDCVLRRKFR